MKVVVDRARYDEFAAWSAARIPHAYADAGNPWEGRLAAAFGVERDGEILAVITYHDYQPWYRRMEISFACTPGSGWATRGIVGLLLLYPFADCGCGVIVTQTPSRHHAALKMNRQLGFAECGRVPKGFGDDDTTICALTDEAARRWIGRYTNGR